MMRNYRVRTFETQFDSLIDLTVVVAKNALKSSPTAEHHFILGAAEGYRCLHQFRQGECLKATNGAMTSVKTLRLAAEVQPGYVDPLFGLALYEYGKGKVLSLGLGLSANTRKEVIRNLERVRQEGRYMSINAMYALQTIYLEAGDLARAMEINDHLYQRFPHNSGCLYNRALLLEKLHCAPEAIPVWKALITRIEAFGQPSNGYLAECHYHLAEIYRSLGEPEKAWEELDLAVMYVNRYQPEREMNGPYTTVKETRKTIEQAAKNQPSEQRRISSMANVR
jgi:tetratricopeptide (TPR) repeat protein